jgi:two-component system, NtrC family, sensor kinase
VNQESFIEDLPILFVDDDAHILRSLERILKHQPWPCVFEHQGALAIERIREEEFSVVVSDFRMPDTDGIEVLSHVQRLWPHTERVLLTAHADNEALERGINEAGITRFLRKPWQNAMLITALQEATERHRLRREHKVLQEQLRNRNAELHYLNTELTKDMAQNKLSLNFFRRCWDAALDAISDPMLVVSSTYRLEGANRAATELMAASFTEVEGSLCHERMFSSSQPCEGCPIEHGRGELQRDEGALLKVFQARAYPLGGMHKDSDDTNITSAQTASYLCIYHDVSEERAFQSKAQHMDKMVAIGRLSGGVAHELNNPLHGILTFVQLAQKHQDKPEKVARYHEVIRECALRCRDIVSNLRHFSRRSYDDPHTLIDLNDICEQSLVLFKEVRGERLKRSLWMAPIKCMGNANRLQQIVVNLVQNAFDASRENEAVSVRVELIEGYGVISVEDKGPGVPSQEQKHIFEPFFTTKPEGVGTGLGLAISHSIAKEHAGELLVKEGLCGGARFELRLPVALGTANRVKEGTQ